MAYEWFMQNYCWMVQSKLQLMANLLAYHQQTQQYIIILIIISTNEMMIFQPNNFFGGFLPNLFFGFIPNFLRFVVLFFIIFRNNFWICSWFLKIFPEFPNSQIFSKKYFPDCFLFLLDFFLKVFGLLDYWNK